MKTAVQRRVPTVRPGLGDSVIQLTIPFPFKANLCGRCNDVLFPTISRDGRAKDRHAIEGIKRKDTFAAFYNVVAGPLAVEG